MSAIFRCALVSVVAISCGGKSTAPQPPAKGSADPTDIAPPADMAFKDMNADQRIAFMKLSVMPAMKPMFREFDPKNFGDIDCKTCHGAGAEDGSFEMPNPDLTRLPKPEDFMAYAKDPKHAPWVQFMVTKVKPTMAKLLKVTEYDPQTNTGEFSCAACHLTIGEVPAPKHAH